MGRLLTLEEVAEFFGLREEEILELVDKGVIPSYKVAGVYLRFKEDDILPLKDKISSYRKSETESQMRKVKNRNSILEKCYDFFYFYDYYIIVILVSAFLIWYALH